MAGIAITVPLKYIDYLFNNLNVLSQDIKYTNPIEIWEVGDELNDDIRNKLSLYPNVILKNTTEFDDRVQHWRGFQAKAAITKYSKINDIIVCDADVTLLQDPLIVQQSKEYINTGSYLFRDYSYWYFDLPQQKLPNQNTLEKFVSHDYYDRRRNFIKTISPNISPLFPKEWSHIYDEGYPSSRVFESLVESGLFYINREKHIDVIDTFYDLNNNWEYTYQCVHGDKELLWLAFIQHNKEFSLHNKYPTSYNNTYLLQLYNNSPFYAQKFLGKSMDRGSWN